MADRADVGGERRVVEEAGIVDDLRCFASSVLLNGECDPRKSSWGQRSVNEGGGCREDALDYVRANSGGRAHAQTRGDRSWAGHGRGAG